MRDSRSTLRRLIAASTILLALEAVAQDSNQATGDSSQLSNKEFVARSPADLRTRKTTREVVAAEAARRLQDAQAIQHDDYADLKQLAEWAAPQMKANDKADALKSLLARKDDAAQFDSDTLRAKHALMLAWGAPQDDSDALLTAWLDAHPIAEIPVSDLEFITARLSECSFTANKLRVEWTGFLRPEKQGLYYFSTTQSVSDDDSTSGRIRSHLKVWLSGALTIDTDQFGWQTASNGVLLDNSRSVSIKVEFTHERPEKSTGAHPAMAMLYWEGAGAERQIVPASAFRQTANGAPGLNAQYECTSFNPETHEDRKTAAAERVDPQIDFAWWSAAMDAFRPHHERLQALANELSKRYVGQTYLSERMKAVAGKQRTALDSWAAASALFTSAQRQAVCRALAADKDRLAKINAAHMRRIFEWFRPGAEDAALDLWGQWFNLAPDYQPTISKDLSQARTDPTFLGVYLWQSYPAGLTSFRDKYVVRPDGDCCLNSAFAAGYAYAVAGNGQAWAKWVAKQLENSDLSGDKRANWLLIQSNAEQIRSFKNPRGGNFRPTENPLDGLNLLDEALTAAESDPVKFRIYKEQISRYAAGGNRTKALEILTTATAKLSSPDTQRRLSEWRQSIEILFPNQPAAVADLRPGAQYREVVERRWKVISQVNDPVAHEAYRRLAQKIGAKLTDAVAGDAQKKPREQNISNRAEQKTLTNNDYYPAALAFHRRTLLDAYRDHGDRNEKWDAEVEVFLLEFEYRQAWTPWMAQYQDLAQLAEAAVIVGCQDPIVCVAGNQSSGGLRFQNDEAHATATQLLERKDAPHHVAWAAVQWAQMANREQDTEAVEQALQMLGEQFQRMLNEDWIQAGEQRAAYRAFCDIMEACPATSVKFEELLNPTSVDESRQWFAHMVASEHHSRLAWRSRGTGYSGQVTNDGWRGFEKNLQMQKKDLQAALKLKPEWPEPAAEMIMLAANSAADAGETIETWFQRALDAQCDFGPAYARMRNFALPRWSGSYELMLAAGRKGLETGRFDTFAPLEYIESICAVAADDRGVDIAYFRNGGHALYEQVRPVFDGYETSDLIKWQPYYIRSLHALLAHQCGEFAAARKQLEQLDGYLSPKAVQMFLAVPRTVVQESFALGGPLGKQFLDIKSQIAAKDWNAAEQGMAAVEKQAKEEKFTAQYFADLRAQLEFQKKFDTNEWVDLKIDKDLTGWETLRGKFRRQNDSTIVGRAESVDLAIRLLAPVGHRFEYRGEVTIPRMKFNTDNGGPLYCVADLPVRRIRSFLIYPAQNRKEIAVRRDLIYGDAVPADVLPGKNRFHVTVWDKTQTLRLNGAVVHQQDWLREDENFGEAEYIGLGAHFYYDGLDVQFSNLQVRKLVDQQLAP